MKKKSQKKTKNIRILESSYRRLKLKTIYRKQSLMEVVDDLSKIKIPPTLYESE